MMFNGSGIHHFCVDDPNNMMLINLFQYKYNHLSMYLE